MNDWQRKRPDRQQKLLTEPETEETEPLEEAYVSPIDFEALTAENPDTIGWIRIPDTNVDYPIVQGTDNDFIWITILWEGRCGRLHLSGF